MKKRNGTALIKSKLSGLMVVLLLGFGCNKGGEGPLPGDPCNPDVVHFTKDIQPILLSGCAYSGCHDSETAADDVILDTYDHTISTGDVTPGDANDSELYTVLMDNPEDIMPPPPDAPLSTQQIELIRKWIEQGAMNLECDAGCDNTNPTWTARIWPIVEANCRNCHSGNRPDGEIPLTSYPEVRASINQGEFLESMNSTPGFSPMPPAGLLSQCDIDAITIWIEDGALEN